jgi:hypothetical protein
METRAMGGVDVIPDFPPLRSDAAFGAILYQSESIYRRNFAACFFVFLVTQGVAVLCVGLWAGLARVKLPGALSFVGTWTQSEPIIWVLTIAWFALFGVAQGLSALIVTADLCGRRLSGPEALVAAWRVRWKLPLTVLVTSTLLYAGLAAGGLLTLAFYVMFYVAIPAAVLENRSPLSALDRSWRLVSKSNSRTVPWLHGLGRAFMLGVASVVLGGFAVGTLAGLLMMIVDARAKSGLSPSGLAAAGRMPVVMFAFVAFAASLVYPFFSIAHTVLYYDIRRVHEGWDVEALTAVASQEEGPADSAAGPGWEAVE